MRPAHVFRRRSLSPTSGDPAAGRSEQYLTAKATSIARRRRDFLGGIAVIREPRSEPKVEIVVMVNGRTFHRCPLCDALVDPAFLKSHDAWAHPRGKAVPQGVPFRSLDSFQYLAVPRKGRKEG